MDWTGRESIRAPPLQSAGGFLVFLYFCFVLFCFINVAFESLPIVGLKFLFHNLFFNYYYSIFIMENIKGFTPTHTIIIV